MCCIAAKVEIDEMHNQQSDCLQIHPYFVCLIFLHSSQKFFSYVGTGLPGLNQYLARINVSFSKTRHSDAGEARTHGPSVSSQALYHWATVLPKKNEWKTEANVVYEFSHGSFDETLYSRGPEGSISIQWGQIYRSCWMRGTCRLDMTLRSRRWCVWCIRRIGQPDWKINYL